MIQKLKPTTLTEDSKKTKQAVQSIQSIGR
jgi:hypothetical protein